MTSTRLPGKVLMKVGGVALLSHHIRRLALASRLDDIVVATTSNSTDDVIVRCADSEHVRWFRGSEDDVLGRYVAAAVDSNADVVVRTTADCPLIDAEVVNLVVDAVATAAEAPDYASNVVRRTYPRGLDAEAMTRDALRRADQLAPGPEDREHVTRFILASGGELFSVSSVEDDVDNSDLSVTVDTLEDLEHVSRVFDALQLAAEPGEYRRVVRFLRMVPDHG